MKSASAMKRKFLSILGVWILILSCQVVPTPPPLKATSAGRETTLSPAPPGTQTTSSSVQSTSFPGDPVSPAFELASIKALAEQPFADTAVVAWEPSGAGTDLIEFPVDLNQISNRAVIAGLTNTQRRYLLENGFIVVQGQEKDFSTIRHKVSTQYGQPYFMSTDTAAYALKSTADAVLIALEREELSRRLTLVVKSTLDELQSYLPGLLGSALEKDAKLALVYLSVGLQLLDPEAQIGLEPDLQVLQRAQVEQVLHAAGVESLTIQPEVLLDFRVFSVPEIYQGDTILEAYYPRENLV